MAEKQLPRVLGVGSPIVDLLALTSDEFLETVPGAKGGMELVAPDAMDQIIARLERPPEMAPGGSAANTVCTLARLGVSAALLGKMGEDESAAFYRKAFAEVGGGDACFKYTQEKPTGRCLSLITPDGERTMRTDLGAAMLLTPEEVLVDQFKKFTHVHVEGYTLLNASLTHSVFETARAASCTISLDLASFEVVRAIGDTLTTWLCDYVDMVFANKDEACAFYGGDDPEQGLDALCALCDVVAVKLGARGAWLQQFNRRLFTPAKKIKTVVDTTGAGDCWAGGFLYGLLNGWSLADTGTLAALVGAETVATLGASPGPEGWRHIMDSVNAVSG